jgi:hypothetical protein
MNCFDRISRRLMVHSLRMRPWVPARLKRHPKAVRSAVNRWNIAGVASNIADREAERFAAYPLHAQTEPGPAGRGIPLQEETSTQQNGVVACPRPWGVHLLSSIGSSLGLARPFPTSEALVTLRKRQ